MRDAALMNYIHAQLSNGHSIDDIRSVLIKKGHPKEDVDDTIAHMKGGLAFGSHPNMKALPFSYAGFWIRFVAALIDSFLIYLPCVGVSLVLGYIIGFAELEYFGELIAFCIIIYCEGSSGQTPGKRLVGIKVVDSAGQVIGVPAALLRGVGKLVSAAVFCIGYLAIAFNSNKQGWHDSIAKTYVIYAK